jgi:hypothetical protein
LAEGNQPLIMRRYGAAILLGESGMIRQQYWLIAAEAAPTVYRDTDYADC